jgi:hypothetical protein
VADGSGLTPAQLFERFRKGDLEESQKSLRAFKSLPGKQRFLGPAREFFRKEEVDQVRSSGAGVLEGIGGRKAFACLLDHLDPPKLRSTRAP